MSEKRVITATVLDTASFEDELNKAERILRLQASHGSMTGILIHRTAYNSFTAELTEDVPYGITQLRDTW